MITRKPLILLLLNICLFPFLRVHADTQCHQQACGLKHVPYPFGFSSACRIRLHCSPEGQISVGEFSVQSISSDSITIAVEAQCNRSLSWALDRIFSHKYAPTSRNALLLQNCTSSLSPCMIPMTRVQTHFETSNSCRLSNGNVDCYSEMNNTNGFMNKRVLEQSQCQYLVSSISADESSNGSTTSSDALSLEIGTLQLEWWLDGDCQCSQNADCTRILEPINGKAGHRCHCRYGFEGDGFLAGEGCRKASSPCNLAKYMLGQCGGRARFAVLIGGVVVGATLMIVITLICCFIRKPSKLKVTKSTKRRLCEATDCLGIPIYAYKEIERATDGFSEKQRLGTGAYGTVYAGKLQHDKWVAIKKIKHGDTDNIEQVVNEIKILSSVNHPNLVRLLGCCIEHGQQILVYEFMPNGTLCQHLQRERGQGLPWLVRLTIAAETAQAIAHLHSAMIPPIYHRDIKSSNILLDHNFRSKVADFGLSRLGMTEISYVSTAPQGTPGYLDPQYHQDYHLSDKSDVYSFGVVLVEIMTAMKVIDFTRPQNEVNLAALAIDKIGKGHLHEMVDPFIEFQRNAWTFCSLNKVAELAFRCLAFYRDMRPSMKEVAAELEQIRLGVSTHTDEKNCITSMELSFGYSSSSGESEKSPGMAVTESSSQIRGVSRMQKRASLLDLMHPAKEEDSQVFVQDYWCAEKSSPPSNSFLPRASSY